MKLTKMDMAKVIVTALYNLDSLVTEKNKVAWKHAEKITRMNRHHIKDHYEKAVKVLEEKNK